MTSSVDSDYNLRSLGRPLIDSASATDSPDPPTTGFSSPDPITNLTLQFSQFTNQMATLISAVSDQNIATSILKEEQLRTNEAISDLRAQIPHNVASGVTFASRDIHAKLQYHAATEAKNYSDTADRLDDLEAAQPDPVLVKLFKNLTSTMEKVNCTLLAFQKSSIEQQQAQLHQQEMSFHKVQAPVEDTFLTLIKSFHSYRQYKSSRGALIFFNLFNDLQMFWNCILKKLERYSSILLSQAMTTPFFFRSYSISFSFQTVLPSKLLTSWLRRRKCWNFRSNLQLHSRLGCIFWQKPSATSSRTH